MLLGSCAPQTTVICKNRWTVQRHDTEPVELQVGTYFLVSTRGRVMMKKIGPKGEWRSVRGYKMSGDTIRHTDHVAAHKYYNTTK